MRCLAISLACPTLFLRLTAKILKTPWYKTYFYLQTNSPAMPEKHLAIPIAPEMEEYIRAQSTDQRVATTCEGPMIFSIKIAPAKATDLVQIVGEKKLYISAVQAPRIKIVDSRMLPKCAVEKRRK